MTIFYRFDSFSNFLQKYLFLQNSVLLFYAFSCYLNKLIQNLEQKKDRQDNDLKKKNRQDNHLKKKDRQDNHLNKTKQTGQPPKEESY